MNDDGADEGLRARKRAATRSTIEWAAARLAVEHGYESITVEMICEASMVSQRTFFNYFGSKEGVILGATPPMPTEEEIDRFVHAESSDVLGDLVRMITSSVIDHEPDTELLRARRSIIEKTPELSVKESLRMGEAEEYMTRLVLDRFHAGGRNTDTTPDLEDEARMVVTLCMSILRHSHQRWFSGSFTGTPRELLTQSIALIHRITGGDR